MSDTSKNLITLPNIDEIIKEYDIKEVTSPDIFYGKYNKFHPNGLFSEEIFGIEGSVERRVKFAYIDLNTRLIHPYIYNLIKKSNKLVLNGIIGKRPLSIKSSKSGFKIVDDPNGLTGMELFKEIIEHIEGIDNINNKIKQIFLKYKKDINRLTIDKLLVIPPTYRPIIYVNNRPILDAINEIYSKLIYYSQKSSSDVFGLGSNDIIMQEILFNLFESLEKSLSKKHGMIRTHMLGKRLDFTGRSVISPDPTLDPNTVKVPYKILAKITEPFIIHILMTGYLDNGDFIPDKLKEKFKIPVTRSSLHNILKKFSKGLIVHDDLSELIKTAIDIAVSDKMVLVKRDPALHRASWQAMNVIPTDDDTIHFPALKCSSLNADFDGDSVAKCEVDLYVKENDEYIKTYKNIKIEDIPLLTVDAG